MGFSVPEPLCSALLEDVVYDFEVIRKAAAPALAAAVTEHPDVAPSILQQLVDLYDVKLKVNSNLYFGGGGEEKTSHVGHNGTYSGTPPYGHHRHLVITATLFGPSGKTTIHFLVKKTPR